MYAVLCNSCYIGQYIVQEKPYPGNWVLNIYFKSIFGKFVSLFQFELPLKWPGVKAPLFTVIFLWPLLGKVLLDY